MARPAPGAPPRDRLVLACDVPRLADARALVERVGDAVGMVKVGLELFVEAGPAAVTAMTELGRPVFLDLKLHDIPETVERAVDRAVALGARILTVHASGGPEMLRRAVRRAEAAGGGCVIAAVTVLTSLDAADLAAIGVAGAATSDAPMRQAIHLATMAAAQGVTAFVCSVHEAAALREALGPNALLVTPGIRPGGGAQDQKRIATPAAAIAAGADLLVVGRPVRDAPDPRAAAEAIAREIAS